MNDQDVPGEPENYDSPEYRRRWETLDRLTKALREHRIDATDFVVGAWCLQILGDRKKVWISSDEISIYSLPPRPGEVYGDWRRGLVSLYKLNELDVLYWRGGANGDMGWLGLAKSVIEAEK